MTILWAMIEPFVGYLALALTALAAWWGNGALQRRKGRKEAKAEAAAQAARDNAATVERVLHETPSADPVDDIRRRMRERAR